MKDAGSGGFGNRHHATQGTVAAAVMAHRVEEVFQAFANEGIGLTREFGFRNFDEAFDQAGMNTARLGDAEISVATNIGHDRLSLEGFFEVASCCPRADTDLRSLTTSK